MATDTEKVNIQLLITPEANEVLVREAPGVRKRGEWLSELLENYKPDTSDNGVLERIERKIDRLLQAVERQ